MNNLENEIRQEIEDVHDFLSGWFNGTVAESDFDEVFLTRLAEDITFIDPSGIMFGYDQVTQMRQTYGSNPEFRIKISDVQLRHRWGPNKLVTYCEWQRNANLSKASENGRLTTLLLSSEEHQANVPFRWLHMQETWLPDDIVSAASFDF